MWPPLWSRGNIVTSQPSGSGFDSGWVGFPSKVYMEFSGALTSEIIGARNECIFMITRPMISEVEWGLSFPDICFTVEEKPRKNHSGNLIRLWIKAGPAWREKRLWPLDYSDGHSFPGCGFSRGFSSIVRWMSGKRRPHPSPDITSHHNHKNHYGRYWPLMMTRPKTSYIDTESCKLLYNVRCWKHENIKRKIIGLRYSILID